MNKEIPIAFSFEEIREVFGPVTGKLLRLKLTFYDWTFTETQNATATVRVIPDEVHVEVIGRNIRTFKPGVPFNLHVSRVRWQRTVVRPCLGIRVLPALLPAVQCTLNV